MVFFRNDAFCDVFLAKSKQYYNLLIQLKATLPNAAKKLKDKFNIRYEDLSEVYLLPLSVCIETSLRDFPFKVLNYITYINILLKKIGVVDSDICSFCNLRYQYTPKLTIFQKKNCFLLFQIDLITFLLLK